MKKLILITISFSSVSLSQNPHFETTFNFTDQFNNTQELTFGYDAFGTDSLDPNLGEQIVPQVHAGQFGVRFQLPADTSIYTIKDIRYGCGQPFYYEHLIDLSYQTGSTILDVFWNWDWSLYIVDFINPFNGVVLSHYVAFYDSTHFIIPESIEKIIIGILYDGPLSWPEYEVTAPNGGETLVSGEYYTITWWDNEITPPTKLEYTSDWGNTWEIIIDSTYLVNYSYDWLVPFISSENCLIRIGDYPCMYDVSDSIFTITYPVSTETEETLTSEFSLEQNYPNPFNPTTKIKYEIPEITFITLKVYDVLGNEAATLVNKEQHAGSYEVEFDATTLPSGICFYQLRADNFVETKKMVILR
jgi:hypothetical protein